MSRACLLNPANTCTPDAKGLCVCTPPGEDPELWALLTPDARGTRLRQKGANLLTVPFGFTEPTRPVEPLNRVEPSDMDVQK